MECPYSDDLKYLPIQAQNQHLGEKEHLTKMLVLHCAYTFLEINSTYIKFTQRKLVSTVRLLKYMLYVT